MKGLCMKIGFVLPHFHPYIGGGEKLFYDMGRELVKRGFEVHVVTGKTGTGLSGTHDVEGMQVTYCDWKEMFGHPFPKTKDIIPVIEWCDIVHTSTYTTGPVVSKLARKYNKPSVMTIHEVRGEKWYYADNFIKATIYNMVEQFTCRQKYTIIHAVSEATKRDIAKYLKKTNVVRVYNAIELNATMGDEKFDLKQYFGLNEKDKVFLYYGRPGKTKGIDVYEKALTMLAADDRIPENVKFCFILGSEPAKNRKEFIEKMRKNGLLDKNVIIRASLKREELASAIKQADCVVVPSLTEGFGFSALEACQIGTNLIVSDGGALPEVVYGNVKMFRNRDSRDLAKKIYRVIANKSDAFDKIPEKHFTYEAMIDGIANIYKEVEN